MVLRLAFSISIFFLLGNASAAPCPSWLKGLRKSSVTLDPHESELQKMNKERHRFEKLMADILEQEGRIRRGKALLNRSWVRRLLQINAHLHPFYFLATGEPQIVRLAIEGDQHYQKRVADWLHRYRSYSEDLRTHVDELLIDRSRYRILSSLNPKVWPIDVELPYREQDGEISWSVERFEQEMDLTERLDLLRSRYWSQRIYRDLRSAKVRNLLVPRMREQAMLERWLDILFLELAQSSSSQFISLAELRSTLNNPQLLPSEKVQAQLAREVVLRELAYYFGHGREFEASAHEPNQALHADHNGELHRLGLDRLRLPLTQRALRYLIPAIAVSAIGVATNQVHELYQEFKPHWSAAAQIEIETDLIHETDHFLFEDRLNKFLRFFPEDQVQEKKTELILRRAALLFANENRWESDFEEAGGVQLRSFIDELFSNPMSAEMEVLRLELREGKPIDEAILEIFQRRRN